MDTSKIKDMILDAVAICRDKGIKPTSTTWNVSSSFVLETTKLSNGLILNSVVYTDDSTWSCREKNKCEVLECLLLVHQPRPQREKFHMNHFSDILGVNRDWINCFYKGLDGWKEEEIESKEAFELGKEIKKLLKTNVA